MKVVYVAGPYTAELQVVRKLNIITALLVGKEIADNGCAPIVPHSNTGDLWGVATPEFWYEATLELLRRSDGVVFIHGWKNSKGSVEEFKFCVDNAMPFVCLDDVPLESYKDLLERFCADMRDGYLSRWACEDHGERKTALERLAVS